MQAGSYSVATDQRQRLGSVEFEMLVLLAMNAKWINQFGGIADKDLVDPINSAAECWKESNSSMMAIMIMIIQI